MVDGKRKRPNLLRIVSEPFAQRYTVRWSGGRTTESFIRCLENSSDTMVVFPHAYHRHFVLPSRGLIGLIPTQLKDEEFCHHYGTVMLPTAQPLTASPGAKLNPRLNLPLWRAHGRWRVGSMTVP